MNTETNERLQHQTYLHSAEQQHALYKRTLVVVSLSQILGGAGLSAGVTVGALIAQQMLATSALAGVPATLFTLGSAGAALFVGRLSQRFGRRIGLFTGFMLGALGAFGVVAATILNSIALLFLSLFIYGSGTATNLQARYAGTDLASKQQRATAVSIAMVFTTVGAVTGPNLVEVMGNAASTIGIPTLAGPFILAGMAFLLAGSVIYILLRPDPFLVAQAIEASQHNTSVTLQEEEQPALHKRGILIGAAVMILTQLVMVAIMTMTPVHMSHHGHTLSAIGLVISIHVSAMYLPSLFTGFLVDRLGRTFMAVTAGITLLAAGLVGALGSGDHLFILILALGLLGLGWNFGLISGTALIIDHTSSSNRAKTQGLVDVFIALSGASGGALSGMVVASSSYTALSLLGGCLSLLLLPIMFFFSRMK